MPFRPHRPHCLIPSDLPLKTCHATDNTMSGLSGAPGRSQLPTSDPFSPSSTMAIFPSELHFLSLILTPPYSV